MAVSLERLDYNRIGTRPGTVRGNDAQVEGHNTGSTTSNTKYNRGACASPSGPVAFHSAKFQTADLGRGQGDRTGSEGVTNILGWKQAARYTLAPVPGLCVSSHKNSDRGQGMGQMATVRSDNRGRQEPTSHSGRF